MSTDQLPALLRARRDLLHELLTAATPAQEVVARRIAVTGLSALGLYLPDADTPAVLSPAWGALTAELVDIVRVCQEAQDERLQLSRHTGGSSTLPG